MHILVWSLIVYTVDVAKSWWMASCNWLKSNTQEGKHSMVFSSVKVEDFRLKSPTGIYRMQSSCHILAGLVLGISHRCWGLVVHSNKYLDDHRIIYGNVSPTKSFQHLHCIWERNAFGGSTDLGSWWQLIMSHLSTNLTFSHVTCQNITFYQAFPLFFPHAAYVTNPIPSHPEGIHPRNFNIAPEKWWLEDEFPFGIASF